MFSPYARGVGLENWCVAFIFSVAELEYDNSRIDNSVKGKLEAVAKQLKQ